MQKISTFLWLEGKAKEAADYYVAVFPEARIESTMPGPGGSFMSVTLDLFGQQIVFFNGGPHYRLTPALSLFVMCEDQAEVDRLWAALTDGGEESRCGWLVDRFGVSWQIIPTVLPRLLTDPDPARAGRAMQAMLTMRKIDIAAMEAAANGA